MYKIFLSCILILILAACSSRDDILEKLNKSSIKTDIVKNSKKTDIVVNNEPKVILLATYLNGLEKYKNENKEMFLASVYFVNQDSQDLNSENYSFTLNGKSSSSLENVSENEEYKNLLKNSWGNKYLVIFDKQEDKAKLNLTLSNGINKAILNF